ncbi:hypothetical protein HMPREF0185_02812 [Brevundimonas diminuta 470-4]|nr:hypothetical protein HMPREF0185_02812 [Brevundimonas diminuta 470-4]
MASFHSNERITPSKPGTKHLVGPGGRYITGATIDVNAGRTAASVV